MRFFSWGVVIGLLIVLAGLSIVLRAWFHIDLPLFRTAAGLVLLFLGARLLLHAWFPQRMGPMPMDRIGSRFEPHQPVSGALKYDVLFSEGLVDLTKLPPLERDLRVEVNVVFGMAKILLDPSVPYELEASAAFGEVRMPDQHAISFGGRQYQSPAPVTGPRLRLKVSAVFASCAVEENDHGRVSLAGKEQALAGR
jgi:hypothetical protein